MSANSPDLPERRALDRDLAYVPGGFLAAYVVAARAVELEPYHHLRQMRLPTSRFDAEDVVVPHSRFAALVASSAELSQRPDFAVCVAREINLSAFGPSGLLVAAQPTLRAALEVVREHSRRQRWKTRVALEQHDDVVVLRLAQKGAGDAPLPGVAELAVGAVLRLIQGLLGDDWRPSSVALTATPIDRSPYERFFGNVAFGQPFDELRLPASELSLTLPTANPALARLAAHYLAEAREAVSFAEEVRELVDALLPHGLCTIERVAERLGVDRRTVHRRLAEHGLSFSALLQAARMEVVATKLKGEGPPIGKLATALGFSGPSTFSRWFRHTYGVSASEVRKVG